MAMLSFCGIDVAKDRLDVMVLPEQQSFAVRNDAAGCAELIARLRGLAIAAIGLEASGGYERGAMRALLAAALPVCQVNPFMLRQFAKASGILAKSDRLDARVIASFIAVMPTRPAQLRPPPVERLAEMLAVRRQFNAEKVATENAARLLEDAMLQRLSRRRVARLATDIDMLDRHLVDIVETDVALANRYRLLTSMPGVGLVLACTLIALAARARHNEPQTSRCIGWCRALCVRERQVQRTALHLGRSCASSCPLYMAAMSAGNWNPVLKAFGKRLKDTGKMAKVVIVAVMRKMITMLNAMVRDDVVWAHYLHGQHTAW
jgi:transposase